jgi:hypothetical protein
MQQWCEDRIATIYRQSNPKMLATVEAAHGTSAVK